jgi:hypothetical protein
VLETTQIYGHFRAKLPGYPSSFPKAVSFSPRAFLELSIHCQAAEIPMTIVKTGLNFEKV